ncbi:hypothetical protein J6590_087315 [Homalodisca vitripennis]|nr:hypothetical protein J6590_087315 [Homalodisca vitripennis]
MREVEDLAHCSPLVPPRKHTQMYEATLNLLNSVRRPIYSNQATVFIVARVALSNNLPRDQRLKGDFRTTTNGRVDGLLGNTGPLKLCVHWVGTDERSNTAFLWNECNLNEYFTAVKNERGWRYRNWGENKKGQEEGKLIDETTQAVIPSCWEPSHCENHRLIRQYRRLIQLSINAGSSL